ncbi:MAG: WecB/TagA/CpsF family glycosyltransferase [Syntrophomonadaceae bacterium]
MKMDNKAEILGCNIDIINSQQALEKIHEIILSQKGGQVITLNAEIAYQAQKDENLRIVINGADLVTPDGIGIIWGGRQLGYDFPERVTGIDLMASLCRKAADMGWKVYLFGAAPGVAEAAAESLVKQYPGLVVVGCRDGYFKDDESAGIAREIASLQPDILFVALGAPKQEYWIKEQQEAMKIPLCIGVGGSFDVIAGVKNRAPEWAIRLNLEWLYRLLAEPSRWKRQLALPRYILAIKKAKWKKIKRGYYNRFR